MRVTQACNIQSSNKLKIAPTEILTSYFSVGVQLRLFCLLQNISSGLFKVCQLHCKQILVLYLQGRLSMFLKTPGNLIFCLVYITSYNTLSANSLKAVIRMTSCNAFLLEPSLVLKMS